MSGAGRWEPLLCGSTFAFQIRFQVCTLLSQPFTLDDFLVEGFLQLEKCLLTARQPFLKRSELPDTFESRGFIALLRLGSKHKPYGYRSNDNASQQHKNRHHVAIHR